MPPTTPSYSQKMVHTRAIAAFDKQNRTTTGSEVYVKVYLNVSDWLLGSWIKLHTNILNSMNNIMTHIS